jgi:hypothetical protein
MRLIKIFITYDRRNVFLLVMGLTLTLTLFLLLSAYTLVDVRALNNTHKYANNTLFSQQSINNNNSISFLTYREPDLGIKMQYPSNWLKREDGLVLHSIAAFFLMHTDLRDRTNTTFAELDIRIYAQNATSDILSEVRQINNHSNEVILNSYKNPTAQSGFLVLRTLDKKYRFGLEELQVWSVIPTKHILVEMLYLADPLDYSRYLQVAKKIMQSLEITQ